MEYYSSFKPGKCPKCKSPRVVPILYGEPTPEVFGEAEAGKLCIGGFRTTDHDPKWECIDCKAKIFKRKFRVFP